MFRVARILACVALILLTTLSVRAQDPDLQAFINIANAPDVETAARYFPPEIQEAIAKLPREMREELNRNLSILDMATKHNVTLQFSTDSGPFVVFDDPQGGLISHLEVHIDSRTYGNDQSELLLHVQDNADSPPEESAIIRLRFIYPDWRFYEIENPKQPEIYHLDDPSLVAKLIDSMQSSNESSARGQLLNYANAVLYYASQYPKAGVPHNLTQLGPPDELSDPSESRAGLLNDELTTPPFEHDRYRFTYKRKDSERFTIVARPVKYKVTGRKSFFIDESRKIRFTDQDKAPDQHSKLVE